MPAMIRFLKLHLLIPVSAGLACRRAWFFVLFLALLLPQAAQARTAVSVFGGVLTDNSWEEIVFLPWRLNVERPGFAGLGVSRSVGDAVPTRLGRVQLEVEGQVVRHEGLQQHWEGNLPVTARLYPEVRWLAALDSAAFGIGVSHTSREPAFERERDDDDRVARTLIYWHAELAREVSATGRADMFLRLHHRSDADGMVGPGASSNGLVLGWRRRF